MYGYVSLLQGLSVEHCGLTLWGGCAARQNFNVVRMFGFPVQRGFNLQTSAGVYNEQVCPSICIVKPHNPSVLPSLMIYAAPPH